MTITNEGLMKEIDAEDVKLLSLIRVSPDIPPKEFTHAVDLKKKGLIRLEYKRKMGEMQTKVKGYLTLIGKLNLATNM